jgi:hypothetical protein
VLYLYVALVVFALVVPLLVVRWVVRRLRSLETALRTEVPPGDLVLGPVQAMYRGGTGSFSRVKGNGALALTREKVLFRRIGGSTISIGRHDIVDVDLRNRFLKSNNSHPCMVLRLASQDEVGFQLRGTPDWVAALRPDTPPPADTAH